MGCICSKESAENVLLKGLRISEALVEQISVGFENKSPAEQEEILKYIYTNWHHIRQNSFLFETLKETNFVTSADGHLHKPKDLFNANNPILTSIFSRDAYADKYPSKRFASFRWQKILRKTGLQSMRDADAVLQCARRIEFLGVESMKNYHKIKYVSLEVWTLAKTFITSVIKDADLFHDHNFCNVFSKIACVPAKISFYLDRGIPCCVTTLCSYSDAILLKDWPLKWTAAPILTELSLVPPDYSWDALQLRSPPPLTQVSKYFKSKDPFTLACFLNHVENTFKVLKYLDKRWDTLSSSDISELSKFAFISLGDRPFSVTPNTLVTRLNINLSPLAHELPSRYLPFVNILKEMGLQDTLSVSFAMMILSKRRRYKLLNPNELPAMIKLLNYVCDEIELHNLDGSNWKSDLVVPDNECWLVPPNLCLYIDPIGSQYVSHIDSLKLRFVHQDVSERLCLAFGIRKLSDVVVEELDHVEHLQTLEEIGSVSLAAVRMKLLSRPFQASLSRVASNFSSITSGFKNPDFRTLQRTLDSVAERLQFVKSIYTRFWLPSKSLDVTCASNDSTFPEWESECESSHRALYFVDRSCTCILIAEPPHYVPVLDLVAIVVSRVLGSLVPLPIGSLFLCLDDSESEHALKLYYGEREVDSVFLGRDIHPQDALQVKLNPLRPFYKGEIVAWQTQNGNKLKYGRINEDVRPPTGHALYKISLETSPQDIETIVSSHVFWFRNFSLSCNSSSTYRHAIKELEHGRVPAKEFVQAVEEMLSVAGINMDTDTQRLHQNTLSLQERLNESQTALVLEQKKLEIARKEVEAAEVTLVCRICLTSEIDITIVPCGHVLCHQCSSSVSRCPYCRVEFSTTIRICRSS